MILTKHCRGCKCSTCRWQGTDNCLHDTNQPCSTCEGSHRKAWKFIERFYDCKGYERKMSDNR